MFSFASSQTTSGFTKADDSKQTMQTSSYTVTFTTNDFIFEKLQGYDVISLDNGGYLTDIGKPMMPMITIRVALPMNMRATTIQVIDVHEQQLEGSYLMYPAQVPQTVDSTTNQFVQPDIRTYQSDQSYPAKTIELIGQNDLMGQGIANIALYPMHYLPTNNKVSYITSLTFSIQGSNDYICGDYLPQSLSISSRQMYMQMIQNMVMNPDEVQLHSSPTPQPAGVGAGDYDYVIITQDSWVSEFQPLADWKTQKGIPANIVTTTWIYNSGGYSGTNVDKIRAFVQDVYTNWGTVYVLLGGDTNVVPCHFKTISSVDPDPIPNDTYYADYDSDWVSEVNVGRASVTGPGTGVGQIGNFINKILTYEKNPPLTNYAKNVGFFGFDLDSITHSEQCKINIKNSYLPADWMLTTVYDSQTGNHKTNVIAAINAGQNLLNHADHSSSDYMGTGYINHDWGLGNSDMDALNNGNKQGIFYSMGCDPAAFDSSNCIAEHFVRDNNGGGVAFIGNSRYGWYSQGQYNTLSMKYDVYFFRSLFQDNLYKLGAAFSDHKNDAVTSDDYYRYCYTELTLLGDPELPVWKDNPISLTDDHPSQLPVGPSTFTVTVTSSGNPVNQAYVCLWKGTQVYLTGTTNSNGVIIFNPSPTTSGTMHVTVTKQNYLPFEDTATVIGGSNNPPQTPSQPSGPTSGNINIEYTYTTSTTDPEGDQVWYQWRFGSYTTDWLGPYASGAQAQAQYTWTIPGTYDVKVKAKDTSDYQSEFSLPLSVTITELLPSLTLGTFIGGLLTASIDLQNTGEASATNVQWNMSIDGGLILTGQTASGTIPTLPVNSPQTLTDEPVIGFGSVTITVHAHADNAPDVVKTTSGFVFIIFIMIQ